jgi:hypothetical protein
LIYINPSIDLEAFNCPHCQVYSQQAWFLGYECIPDEVQDEIILKSVILSLGISRSSITKFNFSDYPRYGRVAVWINEQLIYSQISSAPLPHPDMPEKVREVYKEVRSVFPHSTRAASVLLRLTFRSLAS